MKQFVVVVAVLLACGFGFSSYAGSDPDNKEDTDQDNPLDEADRFDLDALDQQALITEYLTEYFKSCEFRVWLTRQFCLRNERFRLVKDPNYCHRRAAKRWRNECRLDTD